MATQYMTIDNRLWILKTTRPSDNAALEAILSAGVLQATSVADLRHQICKFVGNKGLPLAHHLFSYFSYHFPQDYENIPTFERYIDLISNGWPEDRPFELALLAMAFKVNIVLVKLVSPLFWLDFKNLFVMLFGSRSPAIPKGQYRLHLLHHCRDSPYVTCSSEYENLLNHFGLLVPFTPKDFPALLKYVKPIFKKHHKKTLYSLKVRRKREKKKKLKLEQKGKSTTNRDRKKNLKKTRKMVLANTTTKILNHLTEAVLTESKQDVYLQPLGREDVYYVLNRYTQLMGEQHLPTNFFAVCACKYVLAKVHRLPVDGIPSFILLAAQPWHRTLDVTGEWVLLNDAVYPHGSTLNILSANIQVSNISECDINICKECLRDLQAGKIPLRSLASFDIGPIPHSLVFVRLTFAKRMFLAVNMTVFNIFRVDSYGARQMPLDCKARVSKGTASLSSTQAQATLCHNIYCRIPRTCFLALW